MVKNIEIKAGIPNYIWDYLAYVCRKYGKKIVVKRSGEVITVPE